MPHGCGKPSRLPHRKMIHPFLGWLGGGGRGNSPGASAALPQASPVGWGRGRMAGGKCRMAAVSRAG